MRFWPGEGEKWDRTVTAVTEPPGFCCSWAKISTIAKRQFPWISWLHLVALEVPQLTQQVPGAEKYFIRALERYLRSPLRLEPEPFCFIQDVFNQLGMLWCNRGGHKVRVPPPGFLDVALLSNIVINLINHKLMLMDFDGSQMISRI